jgi:hypothetical protein
MPFGILPNKPRFMIQSSRMLSRVDWQIDTDASEDRSSSIFRVKESKKCLVTLVDAEDGDPNIPQNTSKYLPVDREQNPRTKSSATSM